MGIIRILLLLLLALLATLPNFISSMAWGPLNVAFAIVVVGAMLWLAVKARRIAKWAIAPLAVILTLPPYPYWIYADNNGTYKLVFNRDGFGDSIGFFAILFIAYAVIFFLMYLVARREPKV